MSSVAQALAGLHDIHLPKPVSPWAIAPGWYALMMIVSIISIALYLRLIRRRKQKQFERQTLQILRDIEINYSNNLDSQKACAAISELLRRIALLCYSRAQVAGLQGDAWLEFLSDTSLAEQHQSKQLPIDFKLFRKALVEYPYQPSTSQGQQEIEALFEVVGQWIKNQTLPKIHQLEAKNV